MVFRSRLSLCENSADSGSKQRAGDLLCHAASVKTAMLRPRVGVLEYVSTSMYAIALLVPLKDALSAP